MTNQPGPNPGFNPQGPQAYASPGGHPHPGGLPPQPGVPGPGPAKRNTLAIVALGVAILAFLFSVIEGAYALGWILIPVALILSIVALVQKFRPKKLAVAALIVSVVAGIAAPIAFLASAARAFNDSFGGTDVTAQPPAASAPAQASQPASTGPAGGEQGQQGTRTNPYPLGTAISADDWTVTVNSFDANATDKVMKENSYNTKPESGQTYALANVTVTYTGDTKGTPMEVRVKYVTAAGNTVNTYDATAIGPDALSSNELYNGASATGNLVFLIPTDDAGALTVSPGFVADEVFVAIR